MDLFNFFSTYTIKVVIRVPGMFRSVIKRCLGFLKVFHHYWILTLPLFIGFLSIFQGRISVILRFITFPVNTLYCKKKGNIFLIIKIRQVKKKENILLKSWFSKLPRGIYSYTRSLCSSSQQYPINFTKCGCLNCPRNITSVCKQI